MHCDNCDNGTEYKASSRNIRDSTVNGGAADKIGPDRYETKCHQDRYGVPADAIIDAVFRSLKNISKIPIVLDPILAAWHWRQLLRAEAFKSFVSQLIPSSTLITPNRMEAEKLADMTINTDNDAL